MLVAILGPDGSGKTTISLRVESALNEKGILSVRLYAQRFGIFPTLRDLLRFDFSREIQTDDLEFHKDESIINPAALSALHLGYYSLEYFLGGLRFRSDIKSKRTVLVFGRYFYDFYFQRNHSKLPRPLIRLFENLVPKPDLVLVLKRDADVIYSSKPELPIAEIKRQQDIISELDFKKTFVQNVDCNCSIEESVARCLELIFCRLR